jgi:hypothetical protein
MHAEPDLDHLDDVVMADRDGHGRFGNMILKKDGLLTAEGQNVYVISLSPDGKYLALGDDEGGLEVSTYANLIMITRTVHLTSLNFYRFERLSEIGTVIGCFSQVHLYMH